MDFAKQIEIGKIITVINAGLEIHDAQVLNVSGPKVLIGWYRNGQDLTQWVSKKRLVKTMEKASLEQSMRETYAEEA